MLDYTNRDPEEIDLGEVIDRVIRVKDRVEELRVTIGTAYMDLADVIQESAALMARIEMLVKQGEAKAAEQK